MNLKICVFLFGLFCCQFTWAIQSNKRLLCYYDASSAGNHDGLSDKRLMKALPHCTHLMYGYAQFMPNTFNIGNIMLKPEPALLKIKFPHLKIFLSLGGNKVRHTSDYLQFLEADKQKQNIFINNTRNFLIIHHFDGLDLALPLPRNKPRKVHASMGLVVKRFKKIFTGDEIVDPNSNTHKQQFTDFVTAMWTEFSKVKLNMSMTVLPNVNSTWYYDIFRIHKHFQFINLFAFDFLTPIRNPDEADYTAPLHFKSGARRLPHANVEYQVNHWIHNGCPSHKLNLGIATYGQAWKMTVKSGLSGEPVVSHTKGPANSVDQIPGVFNYSVICTKLKSKDLTLHKAVDGVRTFATYAFSPARREGQNGIWISFDDPEFAGTKAEYVKTHNLGGVALFDLKHDDFAAVCRHGAFPILKRIDKVLSVKQ